MTRHVCLRWGILCLFCIVGRTTTRGSDPERVEFVHQTGKIAIRVGKTLVGTYVYKDPKIRRPFLENFCSPGGIQVTRNHPPITGVDRTDHAEYHPGIWMAFGDLNGSDYWRLKADVKHVEFAAQPDGEPGRGSFAVLNHYLDQADDSRVVCRELCRFTFLVRPAAYLLIWDSTFSSDREFYFGDQEEMGLGFRVATPIRVESQAEGVVGGKGMMVDAEGRKNEDQIWGHAANWCDCRGTIQQQRVGITIFCHPDNFGPSWFHARDYGLLLANPFGRHAFGQGDRSRVVVQPGESLRLQYGLLLHAGRPDSPLDLPAAYADYLQLSTTSIRRR